MQSTAASLSSLPALRRERDRDLDRSRLFVLFLSASWSASASASPLASASALVFVLMLAMDLEVALRSPRGEIELFLDASLLSSVDSVAHLNMLAKSALGVSFFLSDDITRTRTRTRTSSVNYGIL